ncbi:MAG: hypothetical protein LBN43_08410 [Oscillospiraceae bacterium]|nr:hypothetical protein [Oscillospiraceae bacterium]
MKRIIAILILLALTAATLTACAAKPHPPTEAEIAEFHRTHPVSESVDGLQVANLNPDVFSSESLLRNGWNIIVTVVVIGEMQLYPIEPSDGTINIPYYEAQIIEVTALDPGDKGYVEYEPGNHVYIDLSPLPHVPLNVGEKYLISGKKPAFTSYPYELDKLGHIITNAERTFFITDSSYIIAAKEHSLEYSYTGKTYDEVIKKVQESAIELDWYLPSKDSSLNEKSDVVSAK